MHAPMAYMNGAGEWHALEGGARPDLKLLNTLLTGVDPKSAAESGKPKRPVNEGKLKDRHQAEEESQAEHANKPGGFHNDPDDPSNPNEVRERHRRKISPCD